MNINELECNIEAETSIMDKKVEQKTQEAKELSELGKSMEERQLTFDDEIEGRRAALDSFLMSVSSLKEFEGNHRAEKERLKEIESKRSTISAEIVRLQERREEVKKRVPGLEVEQKKYADVKNFKAAGIKKT